jgi:hypothetical protein
MIKYARTALYLFLDQPPPTAPLFRFDLGAFEYKPFMDTLRHRLEDIGRSVCYSGHSFRGEAQHAADNGILDGDIQHLGRWSSDAFKLTSFSHRFSLNKRSLSGTAPSLSLYT